MKKKLGLDLRMLGNRHGGIGRYSFEIAKGVLELDRENDYIIFYNPHNSDKKDLDFFTRFSNASLVPAAAAHYSILEQTKFLHILNKCRLDLVHFPNFNVPLLYKRPFVVTIHDMVHHKIGGAKKSHFFHFLAYKKVISSAAARAKSIITVSQYSKKDIARHLRAPMEKIYAIYEGTSLPAEASSRVVDGVKRDFLLSRPYFLFVGVMERKKNIISLTRGFDVFIKKHKFNMDLVVAGRTDKHYPEIKYKAMDIKNKDRLVFTGHVSDEELVALYKGAYCFVSASLHEGFGLPGVEAMKFGLPLAVSNIEVFNEIYDNAAIYFNPLDPDDIADKLHLMADDSQFHQKMRVLSQERSSVFQWKKAAMQTLDIYKKELSKL